MIFKSSSGFVTWMPPSMVTPRAKKASGSMLAVGPVMRISAPGLAICSRPGRVLFRMVTPEMTSRSASGTHSAARSGGR